MFFLVGILPGNGSKEAINIYPYLEILVDELLSICNANVIPINMLTLN